MTTTSRGHSEHLHICLRLFPGALKASAETLGLDDEAAALGRARQCIEERHVDAPPLDCDALGRPAKRPKERDHEVRDRLVLSWRVSQAFRVSVKTGQVPDQGHDVAELPRHFLERRIYRRQRGQRRLLPARET